MPFDTQHGAPIASEGDLNLSAARKAWQADHLSASARYMLERDARAFFHQSLSTPCLTGLAAGEGAYLTDVDGRRYLDFHGNSVHQLGHGHPKVVEALKSALDTLPFCPRRFTNQYAVRLAEKLGELWPGGRGKVLFAPGGSEAVGMALKLARVATGRFKTMSFWDSFHGAGLDAVSVGGEALFRSGMGPLLPGAMHAPPPEPYRCRLNPGGDCSSCGLRCAEFIDYVMEREGDVGALIAEPVRCTTVHLPPEGFWPRVREICDKHGALLVMDETAVCLGRSGRMFASEHFGFKPDITVMGKGLGGGVFPMAAVVARPELDLAPQGALGHYTHEKSSLGAAAALAALEAIAEEDLLARASRLGEWFMGRLRQMRDRHDLVGDVRALGMMAAVELVTDRASKTPAHEQAEKVMYTCLERGLSFKVSQGNILTLTPPLNIPEIELHRAMEIIDRCLAEFL